MKTINKKIAAAFMIVTAGSVFCGTVLSSPAMAKAKGVELDRVDITFKRHNDDSDYERREHYERHEGPRHMPPPQPPHAHWPHGHRMHAHHAREFERVPLPPPPHHHHEGHREKAGRR